MQIESISISALVFDPVNARKHDEKNLKAIKGSLAKFGQQKPIVVNQDGVVIAGNGTLAAAQELGWQNINVVRTELTGSEAIAFAIADNRTSELAAWDDEILGKTLKALQDENFDLSAIGFEDFSFEEAKLEPGCGEDDIPEKVEPKTKLGDMYQLGGHRLLCGDSTDVLQVERLMGGEKADMIFTDPPYGVSYADKNSYLNAIAPAKRIQVAIENDHMKPKEMNEFWFTVLSNAYVVTSNKASYYICSPQGGDLMMMMMMSIIRAGWQLKHMLIWVKNNHVLGRCDYNYKHEPILYGWKEKGTHDFVGAGRCKTSVWDFNKPLKNDLHPTMKPIELCEEAILNSSHKEQIVLDLFLGSGSTMIASEKSGRRCYGMELDPHYCDIIVARWEKYTGKTAVLMNGNDQDYGESQSISSN